jgi:hypothetical protein
MEIILYLLAAAVVAALLAVILFQRNEIIRIRGWLSDESNRHYETQKQMKALTARHRREKRELALGLIEEERDRQSTQTGKS